MTKQLRREQISISLQDALRIRSAELWLELGQPGQALMEFEQLRNPSRSHPWAVEVFRLICDRCDTGNDFTRPLAGCARDSRQP